MRLFACSLILSMACGSAFARRAQEQSPAQNDAAPRGPVLLFVPVAEYPEQARQRKLFGQCTLAMQVDAKGNPRDIKVDCSNPLFVSNAYSAAVQFRFKPAIDKDGLAISSPVSFVVHFGAFDGPMLTPKVRYTLLSPPDTVSPNADAMGVYPLTRLLTPPKMIDFRESGLAEAAFSLPEGSSCEVVLVINADGKPQAPKTLHCDDPILEKSAVASLLKSKYKAALLHGKAVASRVLLRLIYGGMADSHQN